MITPKLKRRFNASPIEGTVRLRGRTKELARPPQWLGQKIPLHHSVWLIPAGRLVPTCQAPDDNIDRGENVTVPIANDS